jgi:hypothetical protein
MKTANIPSLGTLPTFSVPTSAANYWEERAAYEYSALMYNLNADGFAITSAESTDYASIDSALDTFASDMAAWFADLPTEGGSRELPTVSPPSFPDIVSNIVTLAVAGAGGVPAIVIKIVAQFAIDMLVNWLSGKIFSGATPDTSEIVDKLEEIRDIIPTILTEATINVISSREDAFFQVGPPAD